MFKEFLVTGVMVCAPLSSLACSVGAVTKTINRLEKAAKSGDAAEVERTVKAITAGALGGAALGAAAAPVTFGSAPVVGAVVGAACGCAVSNQPAPAPSD